MIIDNPQSLRKILLKAIPLPEDKDVIVYDTRFAIFTDKDVQELYETNLQEYLSLSKEFLNLSNELKQYEDFINNLKLVNNSYGEKDYILKIQQLETLYAQKYKDIKSIEKKITIYENKIKEINRKIDNQKLSSEQFVNNLKKEKAEILRKKTLELGEVQTCVNFFKDYHEEYTAIIKMLQREIEAEKSLLRRSIEKNAMCEECGKRYYPSPERMRERIHSLEYRLNLHNNKFFKLKEKQDDYQLKLSELQLEIKSLKNEIQIADNLYIKKSPQILTLEGEKFEIFEEINKLQTKLSDEIQAQGHEYQKLKRQIEIYKTSFSNYTEAKRVSKQMQEVQQKIKPIEQKLYEYKGKVQILIDFLEMKYKLYESNLNAFFDGRVKVKLFERNEEKFKKICELKLDNIDITYLDPDKRSELNAIIVQKLKSLKELKEDKT